MANFGGINQYEYSQKLLINMKSEIDVTVTCSSTQACNPLVMDIEFTVLEKID